MVIVTLNSVLSRVEEDSRISTLDYTNYYTNYLANDSTMQLLNVDQAWMDRLSRVGPGIVTALILGLFFWFLLRQAAIDLGLV